MTFFSFETFHLVFIILWLLCILGGKKLFPSAHHQSRSSTKLDIFTWKSVLSVFTIFQTPWHAVWRVHGEEHCLRTSVYFDRRCCLDHAFDLIYFKQYQDLVVLDISGCGLLDVTSVIDVCITLTKLRSFIYRECTNVTQYNLQRIVELCPSLEYIDGINGGIVSVTCITGMLSQGLRLKKLWIQPDGSEALSWPFIAFQYQWINFGPAVQELLPCRSTLSAFEKLINCEL